MLRYRRPDGIEKSDASSYISIGDLRCCNYYFRMFHNECCVAVGIFVSESQTTWLFFWVFFNVAPIYFGSCSYLVSKLQRSVQWKIPIGHIRVLASPFLKIYIIYWWMALIFNFIISIFSYRLRSGTCMNVLVAKHSIATTRWLLAKGEKITGRPAGISSWTTASLASYPY